MEASEVNKKIPSCIINQIQCRNNIKVGCRDIEHKHNNAKAWTHTESVSQWLSSPDSERIQLVYMFKKQPRVQDASYFRESTELESRQSS